MLINIEKNELDNLIHAHCFNIMRKNNILKELVTPEFITNLKFAEVYTDNYTILDFKFTKIIGNALYIPNKNEALEHNKKILDKGNYGFYYIYIKDKDVNEIKNYKFTCLAYNNEWYIDNEFYTVDFRETFDNLVNSGKYINLIDSYYNINDLSITKKYLNSIWYKPFYFFVFNNDVITRYIRLSKLVDLYLDD